MSAKYSVRWSIDNFSHTNEGSYSPIFECDILDETKWRILVLPKGKEDKDYVDIYLRRVDDNYKIGKISIILSVELESKEPSRADPIVSSELDFGLKYIDGLDSKESSCADREESSEWDFGINDIDGLESKEPSLVYLKESSELDFGINDIHGIKRCFKRSVLFGEKRSVLLPNDKFSVFVTLKKSPRKLDSEEEFSEIIEHKFLWTIKNWREIRYAYTDRKFTGNYEAAFRMFICRSEELDRNIILQLRMLEGQKDASVACRIAVLDAEYYEVLERSTEHNFSDCSETTSENLFILEETIDSYLEEDTLRLRCVLYMDSSKMTKKGELPKEDIVECSYKELVKDFENMYLNRTPSDLVIKAGDKKVKCHKSLLCEKSLILQDLVDKAKKKAKACVVIRFTDVDSETLEQMICFLYSGMLIDMNPSRALRLLEAGHKYQLSDLKRKCSSYLGEVFNSGNVYKILIAAHRYDDEDLKQRAIEYICENYCLLRPSDEYKIFSKTEPWLVGCILRKIMHL